jgi:acyl CoA:acetate/3-ketoacid CoA transferase alpha subunit
MFKRITLGLLLSLLVALGVGALYYWRASQPYRALARQGQREAEEDISTIANMKDYDRATIRKIQERQVVQAKQMTEIESMRQQARLHARIAAAAAGVGAFGIWMIGTTLFARRRKRSISLPSNQT